MKTIILTIIGILFTIASVFASTDNYSYLKIYLEDNTEISYPPGTGFVAEDEDGNTVLNPKSLEDKKIYEVKKPITLWVFTSWNEEPDVFEMNSGKLILGKSDRTYSKKNKVDTGKKPTDHYSRPTDIDPESKYGKWVGNSNGLSLNTSRFFSYNMETGYDASLEFSDGTIFYYKDGKASAWKDGKDLIIEGKYMIKTNDGTIKLSYNPKTKKIWWVFDKNE